MGLEVDVTGYADFVDPIDLVQEVAAHPPVKVVVLTDPKDRIVPASLQTAYFDALSRAGVSVERRWITARDHHSLRQPAIADALWRVPSL
jgi:predicted esterase